jgi:HAD superfamily hydrolase (TIGR01490 family)
LRRWTYRAYWAYNLPIYLLYKIGLISEESFRSPWAAKLAWFYRGYSIDQVNEISDWVVTNYVKGHWREDVRQRLEEHNNSGDIVVLVSGGGLPMLQRLAQALKITHYVGTEYEIQDGHYTGRTVGPACIGEYKVSLTRAYLEKHGLPVDFQDSFAYADSIADLELLQAVGNPIATYPDGELRTLAERQGWSIFPD